MKKTITVNVYRDGCGVIVESETDTVLSMSTLKGAPKFLGTRTIEIDVPEEAPKKAREYLARIERMPGYAYDTASLYPYASYDGSTEFTHLRETLPNEMVVTEEMIREALFSREKSMSTNVKDFMDRLKELSK